MAFEQNREPKVTEDDFIATFSHSDEELWDDLVEKQPKLARLVEQQAVRMRRLIEEEIEEGNVDTVDLQKRMINMNVFSIEALIHAYREWRKNKIESDDSSHPPLPA